MISVGWLVLESVVMSHNSYDLRTSKLQVFAHCDKVFGSQVAHIAPVRVNGGDSQVDEEEGEAWQLRSIL